MEYYSSPVTLKLRTTTLAEDQNINRFIKWMDRSLRNTIRLEKADHSEKNQNVN